MSSFLTSDSDLPRQEPTERHRDYLVVARRYRPQTFDELVGQEHVAKALSNAISTHRVGHAYLFTGARGVGKTSAARILAKALNCPTGPTPTPCNRCEVCEAISAGEDVDVLEIDGASNRGIDEIRQLRQNVNVRPSRERFKIYIIDEVHMLTREAFNALLKTLEEPPEHVKFIFCTTEPTKIPVTILSRCQRFDFAGIQTEAIVKRLAQIVEAEKVTAEPEALQLLARRAAGSMRDSQSLLEQLLAFAPERITVADVNAMLGIAGAERLLRLVRHLAEQNAAETLREFDVALREGVDAGLLVEQLLGFYRDIMVSAVGCSAGMLLHATPDQCKEVADLGARLGVENVLAVMQILDQTLVRLRYSTQARILAELALVRIATMGDVVELANLVAQLQEAPAAKTPTPQATTGQRLPSIEAGGLKKKGHEGLTRIDGQASSDQGVDAESASRIPLTAANARQIWLQVLNQIPGLVGEHARHFQDVAIRAPNQLVVAFSEEYTLSKSICDAPEQKAQFERLLAQATGEPVRLGFVTVQDGGTSREEAPATRGKSVMQRRAEASQHPMVRRAMELFEAFPERIDIPNGS
jgi:DNA polymerase-3 subunit gamma/tau